MTSEDESKKEEIEIWTPEDVFKTYDQMFKDFRKNVLETWTKSPITEPSYWEKSVIPRMIQKPPVNLVDEGDAFKLTAETPGFDKDDIEIEITENKLNMTGKRDETKEVSKADYRLNEIRSKNFKRSISFPEKVLPDKSKVEMKNGVLTVKIPKETPTSKEKVHKLEIS